MGARTAIRRRYIPSCLLCLYRAHLRKHKHPNTYNTQTALAGVSAILFSSFGPCYYYTSGIWTIDIQSTYVDIHIYTCRYLDTSARILATHARCGLADAYCLCSIHFTDPPCIRLVATFGRRRDAALRARRAQLERRRLPIKWNGRDSAHKREK